MKFFSFRWPFKPLSFQAIYSLQILGNETLIIADYKYGKNFFKVSHLEYKVMVRDDNIWYQISAFD